MSDSLTLYESVHARFRQEFGPPLHTLGKDDNWCLRISPKAQSIKLLLNGSREEPALWVFDPHPEDEVFRQLITHTDQLDAVIDNIRARVRRASGLLDSH